MKIKKPRFWDKKVGIAAIILLPVSFLFQLLLKFKKMISNEISFKIPVICVGNIYLGGTGKTPLSIMLAQELKKEGKKPALIRKYYIEHNDEHNLINNYVDCLFVDKERSIAIEKAQNEKYNIAILDDGFQDYSIKKNLNIICFNSAQLVGNNMTLPSGPLREKFSGLKKVQIVLINGNKNEFFEKKILNVSNDIKIFYSKYLVTNIDEFKRKELFAFAGIGNPENFFDILNYNNFNIKKKVKFADHYQFSKNEIKKMIDYSLKNNLDLITTEKDYLRIKHYGFKNIRFLKIKLEILEKEKLIQEILRYS